MRERPGLAPPPESAEKLARFPRWRLETDRELWRVTRAGRGAWWFGSSGAGRFDLAEPEGTCYLAADPVAALLEVVGPGRSRGAVSAALFADRRLVRLGVPRPHPLADLTSRRTAGFGVTAEISTLVPYDLSRAWAAALRRSGASGLRYWLRHDPGRSAGYALFGRHGERRSWPRGRSSSISEEHQRRLTEASGIEVLPVPRLDELEVVP